MDSSLSETGKSMSEVLVCPKCRRKLSETEKSLVCQPCNIKVEKTGKLYDFIAGSNYYGNEIAEAEMEQTISLAVDEGWRNAVKKMAASNYGLAEHILSASRTDWLYHCVDFSRTGSCLDIGSGWGSNTFALSRYFDNVWSLDAVKQKIEFQRIRQDQDQITNVTFVRIDGLSLPFPDNYFDLVVADGVLEWIGLSDYSGNPRDLQIEFLKEVRRILKPEGCLYTGIKNRLRLPAWSGHKGHSDLPFAGLMPRKTAGTNIRFSNNAAESRLYGNGSKRNDYHTRNISRSRYDTLLKQADYMQIDYYWTDSCISPALSGRWNDNSFAKYVKTIKKKNKIKNIKDSLAYLGKFIPDKLLSLISQIIAPGYLVYAYKNKRGVNFERKLLNAFSFTGSFLQLSGSNKVNYFLFGLRGKAEIAKFARTNYPRNKNTLLANEEKLTAQNNNLNIMFKEVEAIPVFVEPVLKGKRIESFNREQSMAVLKWLIGFQKKNSNGVWDYGELVNRISKISSAIPLAAKNNIMRLKIEDRMDTFLKCLKLNKIPVTAEHGDFFIDNIIIDKKNVYVIDWEFFERNGDPFFDCIFFTIGNMRARNIDSLDKFMKYENQIKDFIEVYSRESNIPSGLIFQAFPYVILRCFQRSFHAVNGRYLNASYYGRMLGLWDEISNCPDIKL